MDEMMLPPEEDVKKDVSEPTLEEPKEDKLEVPVLYEKLKLLQSRDSAELEQKYAAWTKEMNFFDEGSDAYVAERHIADGGNGLIHLAIFYVD
jgi:hypothetical protein